jgi:hypothetical protein
MRGDSHVRFWESPGVRFPGATQQLNVGKIKRRPNSMRPAGASTRRRLNDEALVIKWGRRLRYRTNVLKRQTGRSASGSIPPWFDSRCSDFNR